LENFLWTPLETMNFNDAKRILNQNNESPHTDHEIKEIIKILEVMSDMAYHNLTNLNVEP
jgi:hypothetical protein